MTAPLLSPAQVAEHLGISPDSVLRAIKRGDLPAVRYGRLVRIDPADLNRFLARHRTTPRLRSTA